MASPLLLRRTFLSSIGLSSVAWSLGRSQDAAALNATTTSCQWDADRILIGQESKVGLFDLRKRQISRVFDLGMPKVFALHAMSRTVHPDLLLVAGGEPGETGQMTVLDLSSGEVVESQSVGEDCLVSLATDEDNSVIYTGDHVGTLRRWEYLASTGLRELESKTGHTGAVTGLQILSNSQVLSASRDTTLRLWSKDRWREERSLQQHSGPVLGLMAMPNSRTGQPQSASFGQDRTLRLWQPVIGRQLRFARLEAVPRCAMSIEEGRRGWVGCDDGQLLLVDLQRVKTMQSWQVSNHPLWTLQWLPGSNSVFSGGPQGTTWTENVLEDPKLSPDSER